MSTTDETVRLTGRARLEQIRAEMEEKRAQRKPTDPDPLEMLFQWVRENFDEQSMRKVLMEEYHADEIDCRCAQYRGYHPRKRTDLPRRGRLLRW
jgi:hypothetical protein